MEVVCFLVCSEASTCFPDYKHGLQNVPALHVLLTSHLGVSELEQRRESMGILFGSYVEGRGS